MLFSVIYEVNCTRDTPIRQYLPRKRRLWQQTEGDSLYDYSYLGGAWEKGRHRKLCAMLTKEQFCAFVSECGLVAEDVETMGSIGAPGFGFGWAPAMSFRGDDYSAMLSAYVTPLASTPARATETECRPIRKNGATERDWARVQRAVLSVFG